MRSAFDFFNECALSGAEKCESSSRSLLSGTFSFKLPPTIQFLDFHHGCFCCGISQWIESQLAPALVFVNGCALSGAEKCESSPRSLLSGTFSFKLFQFLAFFQGCLCFGISQWIQSQWASAFDFVNECALSGAEKCESSSWSLLSGTFSFIYPPTIQFLVFHHGCFCFKISQWIGSYWAPALDFVNGCALSGAEKYESSSRSLLSGTFSFKLFQFLDIFHG